MTTATYTARYDNSYLRVRVSNSFDAADSTTATIGLPPTITLPPAD